MFINPRHLGNEDVHNASANSPAQPHAVAADDYGFGALSSKFNLAQLSLQGGGNATTRATNASANAHYIEENQVMAPRQDNLLDNSSTARNRAKEKRQARRKQKKMQQDAAKTAAVYYGECHIEGVGIIAADKAAKESHRRYKKWWKGQTHNDDFHLSSLGDGLHVPRYNPHKPRTVTNKSQASGLHENNKINEENNFHSVQANPISLGKAHAVAAAITSDVITALPNPSYDIIDRSSGTRNPSPTETVTMRLPNASTTTIDRTGKVGGTDLEQSKKRQRSITDTRKDNDATPVAGNITHHSTLLPAMPAAVVSDPEGNDNDENLIASGSEFEKEKNLRRELQRRGSSYSDYENGEPLRPKSQRRRRPSDFYHDEVRRYRSSSNTLDSLARDEKYCHYDDDEKYNAIMTSISPPMERTAKHIDNAKLDVIRSLTISGGDVTSKPFLFALEQLRNLYTMTGFDARKSSSRSSPSHLEGNWFTLSRPHFNECIGTNTAGEYMYTLGRMSFDMFTPGNLVCSIGGIFNSIEIVEDRDNLRSIPKSLKDDIAKSECVLRRYDIITAFKVESSSPIFGPNSPNSNVHHPLSGTITTYGYVLPDPETPNRLSVWFSGGKIEPNVEGRELEQWKSAFCDGRNRRLLHEKARVLAAKLLLGAIVPSKMEDDGHMEFELARPIGGHGTTYIDVLYMDENLRIVQGQRGSIFVFTRVSSSPQAV